MNFDWKALECVRTNGLHDGIRLIRTPPSLEGFSDLLADVESEVVYGNGCRRYDEEDLEGMSEAAKAASSIIRTFASSTVRVLLLECSTQLLQTADWIDSILPQLECQSCVVDSVVMSVMKVGVLKIKAEDV